MTLPPWLVLAAVISLAIALIYQISNRRYGWKVVGYWVAILLGFLGGEAVAESIGLSFLRVGDLRLFADLIGALLVLTALWFLGV